RDAEVVLTAGHCVYDRKDGYGWATEIYVYPGYDGSATSPETGPYGRGKSTWLGSWTGWTDSGNYDNDLGYIRIDRAVGMLTGWFGWSYGGTCTSKYYNNASYPAQSCDATKHNGLDMYYWSGTFDACPGNQMQLNTSGGCLNAVWGGMSGSGAYEIDGDKRYVQGVCSTSNRTTRGYYCRQFQSWVEWGNNTVLPDARTSTFDLQALNMQAEPGIIEAGTKTTLLKHLATNPTNANPASATYHYKVYLSSNSTITTSDTLLSSQSMNWNFGTMNSVTVNMPQVTIPISTTAGNYWLGVIYDNGIDAANSNNDTSGWDAVPIKVTSCSPPNRPSSITYPTSNCDGSFTVDWPAVKDASSYVVQRDTNSTFSSPTLVHSGPLSAYSQSDLATGTYYYRVKSVNTCDSSAWRTGAGITVLKTITQAASYMTYPKEDKDGTFYVSWSGIFGSTSYKVQRYNYSKGIWSLPFANGSLWPFYKEVSLAPGKYKYAVAGTNICGTGPTFISKTSIKVGPTVIAPILKLLVK
ncbi:MAG: hypothetical protein D3923_07055, partial [Candidatus Electrothrix sp. AR3]|nr:hypothetical protein [Candidatus Electrothrix sp. AR3]